MMVILNETTQTYLFILNKSFCRCRTEIKSDLFVNNINFQKTGETNM